MTFRECCEQATRELGWSEEKIKAHRAAADRELPHMICKQLPSEVDTQQLIAQLKIYFQKIESLTPQERDKLMGSASEHLQSRAKKN